MAPDENGNLVSILTESTNFVFLFAEADETRFLIQSSDSIVMYEITIPELPEEEENPDESDNGEEKEKPQVAPEVKEIWRVDGLEEQTKNTKRFEGDKKAHFATDLHSAVSIQDKLDKEKYKGIKKEE